MDIKLEMMKTGSDSGIQIVDLGASNPVITRDETNMFVSMIMETGITRPNKQVIVKMEKDYANPYLITDVTVKYYYQVDSQPSHPGYGYEFIAWAVNDPIQSAAIETATDVTCTVQYGEPIVNTGLGPPIWYWNNDDNPSVVQNDWQCFAGVNHNVAFVGADFGFESFDTAGTSVLVRIDWITPTGTYFVYTGLVGGVVVINP